MLCHVPRDLHCPYYCHTWLSDIGYLHCPYYCHTWLSDLGYLVGVLNLNIADFDPHVELLQSGLQYKVSVSDVFILLP